MKTTHDQGCGMAFGRPARGTMCPRCRELAGGAPARTWTGFNRRETRVQRDAREVAEVRAHFASERHRRGGCGVVCTFGES